MLSKRTYKNLDSEVLGPLGSATLRIAILLNPPSRGLYFSHACPSDLFLLPLYSSPPFYFHISRALRPNLSFLALSLFPQHLISFLSKRYKQSYWCMMATFCACVCVLYIHIHVCMCACVYVHIGRPEITVRCLFPPRSTLFSVEVFPTKSTGQPA